MSDLVSIVIPIYKVEEYINRCVDSIIRQTYKNLEIILVDDGSPDKCGSICDDYSVYDDRIKVIHKNNGGLSDARNAGIDIAQGNYITFVDSDDWVNENYIDTLYNLITKADAEIAACNFQKTSDENNVNEFNFVEEYQYSNIQALEEMMGQLYVQMVVAWGKLYKRSLFNDVRFPVGRVHEDEFTTYKLIYKANKIVYTPAQLLYYWQRNDSITGSEINHKNLYDAFKALEERAIFLYNVGLEKLSSKAYRSYFVKYVCIDSEIEMIGDDYNRKEYAKIMIEVRQILRKSKQNIFYKIIMELYFIAPRVIRSQLKNIIKFKYLV